MKEIISLAKPDIQDCDIACVVEVLKSGMLVQGKFVNELENKISTYTNTKFSSAVSNGTASLHLALIALGIGSGDEVILPSLSYIATANVIEIVGARCVFVDVNLDTFNIDETQIENNITKNTKAIMPVHEFGLCANMPKIMEIANKHNLYVIEDAACAIGATYGGQQAGSFGHFGSFSFHPRKSITSGEGGSVITNDISLDNKIKTLRNHGIEPGSNPLNFIAAGFNYRMTDFQAALLSSQFNRLDNILDYKLKLASIYLNEIKHPAVKLPSVPKDAKHTFQTFHVVLNTENDRDRMIQYLKENSILTNYGAQCMPATQYYKQKYQLDAQKLFPNAYKAYTCGLAIPIHDKLKEEQIIYISDTLNKFN